jgi:hypothetical protein
MSDYTDLVQRLREDNVIVFGPDDFINGRTEVRKPTAKELEAADAIEAQAKRIEELEAALKPFDKMLQRDFSIMAYDERYDDDFTTTVLMRLGDLRAARAALEKKND